MESRKIPQEWAEEGWKKLEKLSSELSEEITKLQAGLKKQGQNLDQALATQGMTRDDLNRAIRTNKLVSKLVGKDVKVTDEEVNDYLEKNKANLPDTDEAVLKKEAKCCPPRRMSGVEESEERI